MRRTRWIPPRWCPTVDAVVLTGGSAFGLVAAHGAQRWCEENGRGFAVPGGVVPIVPAAAIFDLGRGGDFSARPTADMGYAATAAAAAEKEGHDVERGSVGAGTGAMIGRGQFKGGVGTASVTLENGVVVGALAVVNALGFRCAGCKPQLPSDRPSTLARTRSDADRWRPPPRSTRRSSSSRQTPSWTRPSASGLLLLRMLDWPGR